MTELFGENLMHGYTRADMIDDGSLFDVTETAKEIGFKVPVAMTSAAWIGCKYPIDGMRPDQKSGALRDCLELLYIGLRHTKKNVCEYSFPFPVEYENGGQLVTTLKAVFYYGDEGEDVITIMDSEEE